MTASLKMTLYNEFNQKANNSLMFTVEIFASMAIFVLNIFQSPLHRLFQLLLPLFGVHINGTDRSDIQVKDKKFYALLIAKSTTGFAEAYCNGYVDFSDLEEFLTKMLQSSFISFLTYYHPYKISKEIIHRWFDVQTEENTCKTVGKHYDEVAEIMNKDLSTNATQYSAGYFLENKIPVFLSYEEAAQYGDEAIDRMRELITKKLKLKPGMTVLDIGCGFGGLAKHLAEKYHVHVTAVTLSHGLAAEAKKSCKSLNVDILCMDYRGIKGKFDRITCIEMFCHLGEHHHREFFEHVSEWLKDDGLLLMQTISVNHRFVESYTPFFESHLHFYAHMSRPEEIVKHSKGLFIIEDWRNYGYHLGLTGQLVNQKINMLPEHLADKTNDKFYRQTLFYTAFLSSAAKCRRIQLYSIVFSKDGVKYAYDY